MGFKSVIDSTGQGLFEFIINHFKLMNISIYICLADVFHFVYRT
jgi:hypothetical protein